MKIIIYLQRRKAQETLVPLKTQNGADVADYVDDDDSYLDQSDEDD